MKRVMRAVAAVVLIGIVPGCAAGPRVEDPVAEDRRITAEVVRIVAERDDIVAEDIEVDTRDGVVVLSGFQTDPEAVAELLRRVARVRGVAEVVNRIRIVRSVRFQPTIALSRHARSAAGQGVPGRRSASS